jgi:hypothetical protein
MSRLIVIAIAIVLASCSLGSTDRFAGAAIGEVVTNLVHAARAGDTRAFISVLDPSYNDPATQLIAKIQRSGLETNYLSRTEGVTPVAARLNCHDIGHFQVDLEKHGQEWRVKRIWPCR